MNQITVISLGPGNRAYITLGAMDTMKNARRLILRTARCDAAEYLKKEGVAFDTLDSLYDSSEDFDELNQNAVNVLLEAARTENIVYAVFDAAQDETVKRLMKTDAPVTLSPGVPLAAPFLCAAKKADAQAVPASALEKWDANAPLLLTELDSALLAGEGAAALPLPALMGFAAYEGGSTAVWGLMGFVPAAALLAMRALHIVSQAADYTLGGLALLCIALGRRTPRAARR